MSCGPYYDKAIAKAVREAVEPIMNQYKPPGLIKKISFKTLTFGDAPFRIENVWVEDEGEDHVLMEVAFRWAGEANIAIAIDLPAGGDYTRMVPKVTDLRVAGVARVTLSPLVDAIPGFGAAMVALRRPPLVHFNLDFGAAFGGSYTARAIRLWLDPFIRTTLTSMVVWPNRIVVPMMPEDITGPLDSLYLRHQGLLVIDVLQADGLHATDRNGKADPFVEVTGGPGDTQKTRVVYKNLAARVERDKVRADSGAQDAVVEGGGVRPRHDQCQGVAAGEREWWVGVGGCVSFSFSINLFSHPPPTHHPPGQRHQGRPRRPRRPHLSSAGAPSPCATWPPAAPRTPGFPWGWANSGRMTGRGRARGRVRLRLTWWPWDTLYATRRTAGTGAVLLTVRRAADLPRTTGGGGPCGRTQKWRSAGPNARPASRRAPWNRPGPPSLSGGTAAADDTLEVTVWDSGLLGGTCLGMVEVDLAREVAGASEQPVLRTWFLDEVPPDAGTGAVPPASVTLQIQWVPYDFDHEAGDGLEVEPAVDA